MKNKLLKQYKKVLFKAFMANMQNYMTQKTIFENKLFLLEKQLNILGVKIN